MTEMFGQLGPTVEEGKTERASPVQGEIVTSVPKGSPLRQCGAGEAGGEVRRRELGSAGLTPRRVSPKNVTRTTGASSPPRPRSRQIGRQGPGSDVTEGGVSGGYRAIAIGSQRWILIADLARGP